MKRSDVTQQIGHALRRARKKKHLTQQDIADRTGINRSVIGRYETGEIEISISNYFAICEAIGVDPESVLREAGK